MIVTLWSYICTYILNVLANNDYLSAFSSQLPCSDTIYPNNPISLKTYYQSLQNSLNNAYRMYHFPPFRSFTLILQY